MKISVVICTWNKMNSLLATLQSFCNSNFDFNEFELVITDDGSDELVSAAIEVEKYLYRIIIIRQEHGGRAKARNIAIEAASGDILVFNDDDTLVTSDFLYHHYNYHKRNKNIVLVGQRKQVYLRNEDMLKLLTSDISLFINAISEHAKNDIYASCTSRVFEPVGICSHWLGGTTGNLSVEKKYLIQCGGFDTEFHGWGFEDLELSYRLGRGDLKFLYRSDVVNYHLEHKRDRKQMIRDMYRNIQYFYEKYKKEEEIRLFWEFFCGRICLNDFDDRTYKELNYLEKPNFFQLFRRTGFASLTKNK